MNPLLWSLWSKIFIPDTILPKIDTIFLIVYKSSDKLVSNLDSGLSVYIWTSHWSCENFTYQFFWAYVSFSVEQTISSVWNKINNAFPPPNQWVSDILPRFFYCIPSMGATLPIHCWSELSLFSHYVFQRANLSIFCDTVTCSYSSNVTQ